MSERRADGQAGPCWTRGSAKEIEPAALEAEGSWIAEQRAVWEGRLDRMDGYVMGLQATESSDVERN